MLLFPFRAKTKAALPKKRDTRQELLKIDGRLLPIKVRLNPRARRMIVKVNPANGEITVTAPTRSGANAALAFANREHAWIAGQLAKALVAVPMLPGATIPYRGVPHRIESAARGPAPVWRDGEAIFVRGQAGHAPRRLLDFLKVQAREVLAERALHHAAALGVKPSRITVRDTLSRWGSCSSTRSLSFSWRLILAPEFVLDYVVAHEVAHLREMNHSARFWAHVRTLVPDLEKPQAWLKSHGRELQRYGIN